MAETSGPQMLDFSSNSAYNLASLRVNEEDGFAGFGQEESLSSTAFPNRMLASDFLVNPLLDLVNSQTEPSDIQRGLIYDLGAKTNYGTVFAMNGTMNASETSFQPELFYRHSMPMTAIYCVAYLLVFAIGLVGNFFVIAVVFRSPRMRTVTNFFIVNLAVADILVIIFCLPATLMSNIFVRKSFTTICIYSQCSMYLK